MPHKYRHRPTEVEAIQFDPANVDELRDWLMAEIGTGQFALTASHLLIETEEGDRDCPPGYWVVKGTAGEFYVIRPDIFPGIYETAESDPVPGPVEHGPCARCGGILPGHTMLCPDRPVQVDEATAPIHDQVAAAFHLREVRRILSRLAEDQPAWGMS